ncbi:hypothetical protein D3C78_1125260 [compost metagenome]
MQGGAVQLHAQCAVAKLSQRFQNPLFPRERIGEPAVLLLQGRGAIGEVAGLDMIGPVLGRVPLDKGASISGTYRQQALQLHLLQVHQGCHCLVAGHRAQDLIHARIVAGEPGSGKDQRSEMPAWRVPQQVPEALEIAPRLFLAARGVLELHMGILGDPQHTGQLAGITLPFMPGPEHAQQPENSNPSGDACRYPLPALAKTQNAWYRLSQPLFGEKALEPQGAGEHRPLRQGLCRDRPGIGRLT